MAEFCLDCWKKINETHDSKWRNVLSWDMDLCEECGQYKRVIVAERLWSQTQRALAVVIENIRNCQIIRKADFLAYLYTVRLRI